MIARLRVPAALLLAVAVGRGCVTSDGAAAARQPADHSLTRSWPEGSEAYRALLALREDEAGAPAGPVALPRGIDPSAVEPLRPDDPAAPLAELSLAEALGECAARAPEPAPEAPRPPAEAARVRAMRLYASGVAKLLDGDATGAARDLTASAQVDPTAPGPWLKLAEAQASLGQTSAAMLSYRKAADLGSTSPLALAVLGMQASRSGQSEHAAHYLARAILARDSASDPLLRPVAYVHIARPLRDMGYLRASIEAIRLGLDFPQRLDRPSRFGEEIREIAQRASDLWRDAGDTASRLADDALAAELYTTAAELPSLDPSAVLARRVYVLMRAGRNAEAALLVLDDIASRDGRADRRHVGLLRILRDHRRVGSLTAGALEDLRASLDHPLPASTASALTLARAAAVSDRDARSLLLARLAEEPEDAAAAETLFRMAPSDRERLDLAARLVEQSPGTAIQTATLLVAWHSAPVEIPSAAPSGQAGDVLAAHCQILLGRPDEALPPEAEIAPPRTPLECAQAEAWGLAAAALGRWDVVDSVASALGSVEAWPALATVCRAAQRYDEAMRAFDAMLGSDATVPTLLRASEAALASGDEGRAEALLIRARSLDPHHEGPYEGLITIYQARGDQRQAAEAIRALRDHVPSGHVLRWVNAQELARRGMVGEAERALRELIEDAPQNANALGLLLQIWEQRASVDDRAALAEALAWMHARVESPPHSAEEIAALGRLLALDGQPGEAEKVLAEGMSARPSPVLARAIEDTVRARGEEARADEMALDRLAGAGRGIDTSLEHAEMLVRLDRIDEAIPRMLDAMPDGATLTRTQQARLFSLLLAAAAWSEETDSAGSRAAALDALGRAASLGVTMPWQVNYARWTLLYRDPSSSEEALIAATEEFVASVASADAARSLVGQIRAEPMSPMDTPERARAELAYTLGNMLDIAERNDAALAAYRTALRYNPDHAWAANDLGYSLVERNESLDEAARLLERAYALEPDEPSIVDSLGWLRYKLGQLEDEALPDGATRPGAVSLLTDATALPEGDQRAVIHDHLGDALWRTGDRERAEAMWLRAQQLLVGELVRLQDGGASPRRTVLTETQMLVGDKLDAVRAGRAPSLAPVLDEP